jgi:hypothetical protein
MFHLDFLLCAVLQYIAHNGSNFGILPVNRTACTTAIEVIAFVQYLLFPPILFYQWKKILYKKTGCVT